MPLFVTVVTVLIIQDAEKHATGRALARYFSRAEKTATSLASTVRSITIFT